METVFNMVMNFWALLSRAISVPAKRTLAFKTGSAEWTYFLNLICNECNAFYYRVKLFTLST
jgi:hypothetical protein